MIPSVYRTNRMSFPHSELEKYRGQWVAFSTDGARIVGGGATLELADQQVRAAGENCNEVVFERVPALDDDIYLGSEELGPCCSSPTSTNS